jgi:hypothetical protein
MKTTFDTIDLTQAALVTGGAAFGGDRPPGAPMPYFDAQVHSQFVETGGALGRFVDNAASQFGLQTDGAVEQFGRRAGSTLSELYRNSPLYQR